MGDWRALRRRDARNYGDHRSNRSPGQAAMSWQSYVFIGGGLFALFVIVASLATFANRDVQP
jgi:hypothetical protein